MKIICIQNPLYYLHYKDDDVFPFSLYYGETYLDCFSFLQNGIFVIANQLNQSYTDLTFRFE